MELTARIATARLEDYAEILVFLRGCGDKLLPRPDEDYLRSVEAGLFFVARGEGGALVAVAGAFALSGAGQPLVEMGSCCVAPALRGFGLQKLLVRARIATIAARMGGDARILTAITPQNIESRASVLKAGFEPLAEDAGLLTELCAYCAARPGVASERLCCCDFFHIPRARQRREIAALLDRPRLTAARQNGDRLAVEIEIDALRGPARAALEALAGAGEPVGEVGARGA